jgi:hypothetical protein
MASRAGGFCRPTKDIRNDNRYEFGILGVIV